MLDAVYELEHDELNCYYQWLNKRFMNTVSERS